MPKLDAYKIDNNKIDGPSSSNIKSIQRGELTLVSGSATQNITISPVDITKSIPKISILLPVGGNFTYDTVYATITSPTNLQLTTTTTTVTASVVSWEVIEFNNVKSLQNGLTSQPATTTNITISAVILNKSTSFFSSNTSVGGSAAEHLLVEVILTTTTNLKIVSQYTGINTQWYVIEFN